MSTRRPKSPGWAAFDLKQKQKQIIESPSEKELYPLLSSTVTSLEPCKTIPQYNGSSLKPFSSMVLPSVNYPKFVDNSSSNKPSGSGNPSGHFINKVAEESKPGNKFSRPKTRYSWADDGLIEDILAAVGNDFEKASFSLEAMISVRSTEEFEVANLAGVNSSFQDFSYVDKTILADKYEPAGKTNASSELNSDTEASVGNNNNFSVKDHELYREMNMLGHFRFAPVEPEWEEDDVYLSQRKDAIKLIRVASRHARASSKAFLDGDHYSARHFSMKAREEWAAAKKLNAKAASEILRIRNEKNGMWKLDLHGLHAVEALEALQERLWMIETQLACSGVACPNDVKTKDESVQASSSGVCPDAQISNEHSILRQRQKQLEVITGRGNHSHGEAAIIPAAMRSFLAEKGYRFEEARPGVIMVRPKFRPR
ncbi:hypothetical protein Dimus_011960 [Dionaea muscipula]